MICAIELAILRTSMLKKLLIVSNVMEDGSLFRKLCLKYLESLRRERMKTVSCRRGIQDRTFATKRMGQPKRKTSASNRAVALAAGPMNPREIRLKGRICGNKSNLMSLKPWILGPL